MEDKRSVKEKSPWSNKPIHKTELERLNREMQTLLAVDADQRMAQADRKNRLKEIRREMEREAKTIETLWKKWLANTLLVLAREKQDLVEEKDKKIDLLKKENASLSTEKREVEAELEAALSRLQLQNDKEEGERGTNEEKPELGGWKAGRSINAETSIDVYCRSTIDEGLELTLHIALEKESKAYVTLGNFSVFFYGPKSDMYMYPDKSSLEVCLAYIIDERLTIWEILDDKNDMKAVWFWALEHGVWKYDVEVSHPEIQL